MLSVLDHINSELGPLPYEHMLRFALSQNSSAGFDADLAIQIIQMVAPRFHCDITSVLPRHDPTALSKELSVILIRFGRAHAQKSQNRDDINSTVVMFNRFANTYHVIRMFGGIPDMPLREQMYFLDVEDKHADQGESDRGLNAEQLRANVSNWDITGSH